MSREDKGYEYIGGYYYVYKMRNGKYSLYEGCWGRGENGIVGLEVVRDRENKPLHFDSIEVAMEYARNK